MADRNKIKNDNKQRYKETFDELLDKYNLYWIGPRESDIDAVRHLFVGSITFFGNGGKDGYAESKQSGETPIETGGNHTMSRDIKVDHNDLSDNSMDKFVHDAVTEICQNDPLAKFYMYNPNVLRRNKEKKERQKADQNQKTVPAIDGEQNDEKKDFLIADDIIKSRYICLNDIYTMEAIDSKKMFHNLCATSFDRENMLDIQICKGKMLDSYHRLCHMFDVDPFSNTRFIVQEVFASGGAGTHIVSKPRHGEGLSFKADEDYLCSILQEDNLSVNAHVVIFEDSILLLPPSVQIIRENNNRLMYRGADYITYEQIDGKVRKKFEDLCAVVASKYQKEFSIGEGENITKYAPYRGVLGLDAIIHNGKVEMLECNNRFQSSSNLLNTALLGAKMPSLHEINYNAFRYKKGGLNMCGFSKGALEDHVAEAVDAVDSETNEPIKYKKVRLQVELSNFSFIDSGSNIVHAKRMFDIANGDKKPACIWALEKDGYDASKSYKAYSHLFRISFNTNITSISPEGTLRLNENICEPKRSWMDRIYDFDPLATKISLLVQGLSSIAEETNYRDATNNAIDLRLNKPIELPAPYYTPLVVNSPLNVKFVEFSPFTLTKGSKNDVFCLNYYDKPINDNITTFVKDELAENMTEKNKIPYNKIAFASGDRLRVHISDKCVFKASNEQCKFCNMDAEGQRECSGFDEEDVREVVEAYWKERKKYGIEHFLIGGQSPDFGDQSTDFCAQKKIVKTAQIIKDITKSDRIYAMILPPTGGRGSGNKKTIENILEMVRAGVNEFAFNIEIFDEEKAKKIMPGKAGTYSREDYINALNIARYVIDDDHKENVRTMFVVGLERSSSLKQGLRLVIDNGIQPMLSVFRPMPKTELCDVNPPPLEELYELYGVVEKWCEEKDIHLGPHCEYCQNNTLSLPY